MLLERKKSHSITINAILNMVNSFLTIGFSLITYPYASRVLQVANLGKVNYAASIVSYFILFAGLGFSTYAIREGSRLRDTVGKIDTFVQEIYTANFITSLIAFIIYILSVSFIPNFNGYRLLLFINSISIFSSWISLSWVNVIFEDYLIITIRSIILHLSMIIFMFLLVKNKDDYYVYAGINIFATFAVSLLNNLYVHKYVKIRFTKHPHFTKHISPVLVFFANTLAVSIYLNSDVTMLGWILGDIPVGLYSVAVKIYSAIRTVIAAVYNVAIPRMSRYATYDNLAEFRSLLNKIINTIILISIPTTLGLFTLSKEAIIIIAGKLYLDATPALQILSIAFFFAIMGGALAYCVAVPLRREKAVLLATIISAVENIALNIILIPVLDIKGVALTTLLAEATVFSVILYNIRDYFSLFDYKGILKNLLKCVVATSTFIPLRKALCSIEMSFAVGIIAYIVLAVISFCLFNLLLRNEVFIDLAKKYINTIRRKKRL